MTIAKFYIKRILRTWRKYLHEQPISMLLVIVIWIICLIPIPETPLSNVKFIDKWTHFIMYACLALTIIAEYARRKSSILWRRLLFFALLLPIIMSGLIELAQAYLTHGIRSGEWLDFLANAVGSAIGFLIGIPLALYLSTHKRGGRR